MRDDRSGGTMLDIEQILGPRLSWTDCSEGALKQVNDLLKAMNPPIAIRASGGRSASLPFYPDHELLDLDVSGAPGVGRVFFVRYKDALTLLDGGSGPIHELNKAARIKIDGELVIDYLRWFLFAVRGENGPFVLLDSPDHIRAGGAGAEGLAEARRKVSPLRVSKGWEDGFKVDASIAHGGVLYTVQFAVQGDGIVMMMDDTPELELDGLLVPDYPPLYPEAVLRPDVKGTHDQGESKDATVLAGERLAKTDDREVTKAVVSVLLSEAVRARLGHTLLQRFNTEPGDDAWAEQLLTFVKESTPVIVVESEIPFAEDIVAELLDPTGETFPERTIQRAEAIAGDDTRCAVSVDGSNTKLHLISFHAYRAIWDTERTAHQLAIGNSTVLIGCERLIDVPEPLRRVADLVLTLPRIDPSIFVEIFKRVFEVPPPPSWTEKSDGGDWTRYLLHTDFHAPLRLGLTPSEAVDYLYERCTARLQQVSVADSPALHELHGMGEARQVAEDLIADIAAARAGEIPWSAVDRGLLLVGAPGTGKTTLARAIARECGVKFIQGSAAQWQSAGNLDAHLKAIRATFSEARRYAPSIMFIDEIDSIGNRERLSGPNAMYQTEVVNAVLEQLQGMDPEEPVVTIGATNFVEMVDPALRRAGRLDQVVTIPRPNVAALAEIFKHYLRAYIEAGNVDGELNLKTLARLAFGSTGADVEFFVRGATRRARKERRKMNEADLIAEVTRRPRQESSAVRLTPDELERVAVHEAGHALVSLLSSSKGADITFVSVIPRMDGKLGFVASGPFEGAAMSRREAEERLEIALGGRAAEELVYGEREVGLGAGGDTMSDLAAATRIATMLVCRSGLGSDGSLLWTEQPTPAQLAQIESTLRDAYQSTRARLELHRSTLDRIAAMLVEEQEIDGDSLRAFAAER